MSEVADLDRLVTYELGKNELVTEGVLEAFDAIGFDPTEQQPPLNEFITPHSLNTLGWEHQSLRVLTTIWQHPVEITAEQITIYQAEDTVVEDVPRSPPLRNHPNKNSPS